MYFNVFMVLILLAVCHQCKPKSLAQEYGMKIIHLTADRPRTIYMSDEGRKIFLACEINAVIELEWYYNDKKIKTNPPYLLEWKRKNKQARGSILMIRDLKGKQVDGKYDCVAKTSKGTVKATVNIAVKQNHLLPKGFPQIKTHPKNVHTERKSVDFHCCVAGKPPFRFNWYYNRIPIQSDKLHEISPNVQLKGMTCSNLKIKDAHVPTAFFQCVVMNDIGQVVSKEAKIAFSNGKNKKDYWLRKRRDLSISVHKSHLSDESSKRTSYNYTVVCMGISIGVLVLVALFTLVHLRKTKILQTQNTITCQPERFPNISVSYVISEEIAEDKLSQMVTSLSQYGLKCTFQALPNLVKSENLLKSDRLLVVLTKEYIKALNKDAESQPNTAHQKLREMLHESDTQDERCQRDSTVIVLVAEDIKTEEVPLMFKNCTTCAFPQQFVRDNGVFNELIGLLLNIKPPVHMSTSIQIV